MHVFFFACVCALWELEIVSTLAIHLFHVIVQWRWLLLLFTLVINIFFPSLFHFLLYFLNHIYGVLIFQLFVEDIRVTIRHRNENIKEQMKHLSTNVSAEIFSQTSHVHIVALCGYHYLVTCLPPDVGLNHQQTEIFWESEKTLKYNEEVLCFHWKYSAAVPVSLLNQYISITTPALEKNLGDLALPALVYDSHCVQ